MRTFAQIAGISILGAMLAACGGGDTPAVDTSAQVSQPSSASGVDAPAEPGGSIVDAAQQQGFGALLAAAKKADVVPVLADTSSSLTVFAPTDAAFNQLATQLGFADADALVAALPASALRSILVYHVLPAKKSASDLAAGGANQDSLYRFEEQPAALALERADGIKIRDAAGTTASVTTADVAAGNSVIHVIDKVLIPPGVLNVVQMAQVNPQLSALANAIAGAGLQEALSASGPFTVFAPTNEAFAQAPTNLSAEQLQTVLQYHVLNAEVQAAGIPYDTAIATLANQSFRISRGTPPTIADTSATPARIVATDVRASNGIIHVIDKVLIPAL